MNRTDYNSHRARQRTIDRLLDERSRLRHRRKPDETRLEQIERELLYLEQPVRAAQ